MMVLYLKIHVLRTTICVESFMALCMKSAQFFGCAAILKVFVGRLTNVPLYSITIMLWLGIFAVMPGC